MANHTIHNGVDELAHQVFDPFLNYFVFLVHLILTCYLTLFLYLAVSPTMDGETCLLCFFLDWNLMAFITLPLTRYLRKLILKPIAFFIFILILLPIIILFSNDLEPVIKQALSNIASDYRPIFLRWFW